MRQVVLAMVPLEQVQGMILLVAEVADTVVAVREIVMAEVVRLLHDLLTTLVMFQQVIVLVQTCILQNQPLSMVQPSNQHLKILL